MVAHEIPLFMFYFFSDQILKQKKKKNQITFEQKDSLFIGNYTSGEGWSIVSSPTHKHNPVGNQKKQKQKLYDGETEETSEKIETLFLP